MPEYAVFSRRILTGTISDLTPSTRIAWIAILFEAEKLRGKVKLPVRDLAKLASITTAEAADALRVFQEPDPFSSTKDFEGRRLLPLDGEEDWYQLVAWEKHAEERQAFFARLRQQRAREKKKGASRLVTLSHGESRSVTKEPEPEPEPEPELKELPSPAPQGTKRKPFVEGDREWEVASLLLGLIRRRNPAHKADVERWARDVDRILRVDGRSETDVRRVIVWCQADEFWQNNVLSAAKLRERYDTLWLKMQQPTLGMKRVDGNPRVIIPAPPPGED